MDDESAPRKWFLIRLVLGVAQGLALYLLFSAFEHKVWPATAPLMFAPLVTVALFIPLLVSQALGNLRSFTLAVWTGVAAAIVAALALYDVWHAWPGAEQDLSARAFFACAVFLFVTHALVLCGDADRRIFAHYTTRFDIAWKLGVQVAITGCFVGAFWLVLLLGMALFGMIKMGGFAEFIGHPWICIPLTTITAAVAIHITDTRASLVRGVRTLALTLLGWLLPVIALIALAFLVSLAVSGLTPLWETRYATGLLIVAAAALVIHINAAYQDGDAEHRPPHILRVAGTLASGLLIFFVWIAAYALWLRINQYGWTVERITSAGIVLIAIMFAVGYLVAALLPGNWLKLIERWNVYSTFVFLAVLLALSTPLADPMRWSVIDQMNRLKSGVVKPEKFDFWYLRNHGGRFGYDALVELKSSANPAIRQAAEDALNSRYVPRAPGSKSLRGIAVYPKGRTLPESFVKQDWQKLSGGQFGNYYGCVGASAPGGRCEAVITDFNSDGHEEVLLLAGNDGPGYVWSIYVFKQTGSQWLAIGAFNGCKADHDALVAGKFRAVPTEAPPDLMVNGRRLRLESLAEAPGPCP